MIDLNTAKNERRIRNAKRAGRLDNGKPKGIVLGPNWQPAVPATIRGRPDLTAATQGKKDRP